MDSNPELLPVSIYSEFLEWLQNSRLKRLGNFTYIYDLLQHMTYITLPTKVHLVKAMVFSSSHVWMWELDYKESWAPKNWRFWTVVLKKTLESPLDCKEIKPVNCKGNQSWIFIGRTDAEAETPILSPSVSPSIRVFFNELVPRIRWPEYWSFSFSISPSKEYSGLISFKTDWWISLQSKGFSRIFSNTTVQKHQSFRAQVSL